MSVRRVLCTGASGFLGHELVAALRSDGFEVVTAGRRDTDLPLDLADAASCRAVVALARADAVLHAAAMSSMAECSKDEALAMRCNATATEALAGAGVPMLYVSTDLVFCGRAAPYRSDAAPAPLSAYGRSKRAGELATLTHGGTVVRLPLLFGRSFDGRRGATDMLCVALVEKRTLGLFADEFRTPLHAVDAAHALARLIRALPGGVRHVAGPERVSRFELAQRFARVHSIDAPCWRSTTSDDPTRPKDVSLVSDVASARSLDAMLADA